MQQARAGRSKKRLKKLVSSQRTAHKPFEEGRRHPKQRKAARFHTVQPLYMRRMSDPVDPRVR